MTGAEDFRRPSLPAELDRLLHDLRGPLNAAVMHLEVLKRVPADDPMAQASVQSIHHEMERLAAMLPAAFAVCAIELAGARPLLLRSVVESAIDESARKRVQVDAGAWPEVDGDERLLVLAVRHIMSNALEAGGEDGTVRVSVERDGDTAALVVRDSGSGFRSTSPAAVVRLMAGGKPGHVGVGLLVAQRIARLHGGTLTFETASGGGVVRLVLPVRR